MKKTIFTLMAFVLFFIVSPAHADTITLVADPWLPYVGEEGTDEYGFMVEFVMETLGKAGHKIVLKNMDWDKAIEETRQGKYTAISGAAKEEAPDFVFPENEQAMGGSNYFVLKGNSWRYNGIESLKGKKIGIMSGYGYGEKLDKLFKDNPNIVAETKLINLLEMLSEGKIDIIIEDYNVFMLLAMKSYMDEEIVNAGSDGEFNPLYIAFSPSNPKAKEYAKILSDGMDKLRKSGILKGIMERYGLKDWKK